MDGRLILALTILAGGSGLWLFCAFALARRSDDSSDYISDQLANGETPAPTKGRG